MSITKEKHMIQVVIDAQSKDVTVVSNTHFIEEGEVVATSQDMELYPNGQPSIKIVKGMLKLQGQFPTGTDVSFKLDDTDYNIVLDQYEDATGLASRIVNESNTGRVASDFYPSEADPNTVLVNAVYYNDDGTITDFHFEELTINSLPDNKIPDDVRAVINGV